MNEGYIPVLSDLIEAVIAYSPRVAYAIIALALGWVIGRLAGFLINTFTGKLRLESAFRRTSVGRVVLRSGYTPSRFLAMLGKVVVYLFTVLSALNLLSIPFLTASVQAFLEYFPNFVTGMLILVVGFIFVDWIGAAIEKGSTSIIQSSIIGGIVRLLLYFVIITITLAQMKIDVTILYIFAQAFAWSMAIAVGIAFGWNLKDKVSTWLEKMMSQEDKAKNAT